MWTWGENLYGQLGIGNTTDKTTPVQVTGLSNVVSAAVATGAFHCLAIKSDGTVWSWGRNTYGNLGDNTIINSSVPVQVNGVTNVTALAAGTNFSLLQKNDGSFWGCGRNASGQLGDGTTTQRNTFTQATGLCSVMQPVGIDESKIENGKIKVFPNPSNTGIFNIEIANHFSNDNEMVSSSVMVFNATGQVVKEGTLEQFLFNSSLLIDISDFPNGMYFLVVRSGSKVSTVQIIKE